MQIPKTRNHREVSIGLSRNARKPYSCIPLRKGRKEILKNERSQIPGVYETGRIQPVYSQRMEAYGKSTILQRRFPRSRCDLPLYIPPFHLDARFGSRVAHLASSVLHRYGLVVRSGRYTAQNQQREIARIPKQLVCDSQCRLPCSQRRIRKSHSFSRNGH